MELRSRGYTGYVGKKGVKEVDFFAVKRDQRIYFQVTYFLASEEVIKCECDSLLAIKDSYPKIILSIDRLPMGGKKDIQHKYLIDFLEEPWS